MSREAEIVPFLSAAGWGGATRMPLAGDASARRYERLRRADGPAILMDVDPASGLSVTPFLAVDAWLRDAGLSAPAVLAADPAAGLVLLEDLGDDLFARICAESPDRTETLYAAAVDLLADMQPLAPPTGAFVPAPYDLPLLLREARLALEWYLPGATGHAASPALAAAFETEAGAAFAPFAVTETIVYRDYHAENLLWLPDRAGPARIGLLDFQDMLVGHPAYDLVSLLKDARRDVDAELRTRMQARYVARRGLDAAAFDHAAHALSAQRNLKIIGLFARLAQRDGKRRYLDLLPRVWSYLQDDLSHPALAPLATLVAAEMPAPEPAVVARLGVAA